MIIGGLDVGTTGCKLTAYTDDGVFCDYSYKEYDVSRTHGEHEIDANVIFESVCGVISDVASRYPDLAAIGVTTFGETFAVLDSEDNVLLPSMLYTDNRGIDETAELLKVISEDEMIKISGVKPNQMYSLAKLMWIKKNRPDVYEKTARVLLMEDFIVYMLSGVAQINYSLASRTMAFDIRNMCWSEKIFKAAGIDSSLMSKPVPAGTVAGNIRPEYAEKLGVSKSLVILNGAHDQVASAIGAGALEVGMTVDGTGTVECVVPVFDHIPENKALYDEGYAVVPFVKDGSYVCYAMSFTGGATLKWYRDNFAKYERITAEKENKNVYAELDAKVSEKPSDLLILPHFAGAANPYMDSESKAAIVGLTLEHTGYDIYKALMEGVTFEIMTNIEHLEGFGIVPKTLYATGGGAMSEVWLQIKADILNRPITSISSKGEGACGTCMLVAVALGVYKDLEEAKKKFVTYKKTFTPNPESVAIYQKHFKAYKKIYGAVKEIIEEM